MKAKYLALWIVLFFSIGGCHSGRNITVSGSGQDGAIEAVIMDFSKIRRLYKTDSVFSIQVKHLRNNNNILVVSIIRKGGKLLLKKDYKAGTKGKLPSRYAVKDGKLFYWWDDDITLTEEALAIFGKYNLLQDDENGLIQVPSHILDDSQRGADYYFCKDSPGINQRIITNIGFGYYEPPKLNCKR